MCAQHIQIIPVKKHNLYSHFSHNLPIAARKKQLKLESDNDIEKDAHLLHISTQHRRHVWRSIRQVQITNHLPMPGCLRHIIKSG